MPGCVLHQRPIPAASQPQPNSSRHCLQPTQSLPNTPVSMAPRTRSAARAAAALAPPSATTAGAAPAAQQLLPMLALLTGTLLVLQNQVVSNQAAISPAAQALTLTRYLCTCSLSLVMLLRERRAGARQAALAAHPSPAGGTRQKRRALLLLALLGLVDVSCYAIYNLGFSLCGSALATATLAVSSQLATAALSVTLLRRQLRARHMIAVAVATLGLLLRSLNDVSAAAGGGSKPARGAAGSSGSTVQGVLCVMLSALLFSVLGVLYEAVSSSGAGGAAAAAGRRPSQAQASFVITSISLLVTLAHQLLWVWPRRAELVLSPLAASGASLSAVLRAHACYGLITAAHQFVQLRLLASHGAMALGLVNAVRAAVVSVLSGLLFCSPARPHLCLTPWRGASAAIVTLGASQWVLAGKPATRVDDGKGRSKKEA